MKTCEICDRPIRSGRKYCWEHRHNNQSIEVQNIKSFNQATKSYISYHRKRTINITYNFILISSIILGIHLFIAPRKYLLVLVGIYCILLLVILIVLFKFFKIKTWNKVKNEINKKHPDYIVWLKKWKKLQDEDLKFRKSIFSKR